MTTVANLLRQIDLSVEEISSKSGVSAARVREILDGHEISYDELRLLSSGLRIPLRDFAYGKLLSGTGRSSVLFRATKSQRKEIEPSVGSLFSYIDFALEYLPPRRTDDLPNRFDFKGESYDEAARLAQKFREWIAPQNSDEPLLQLPALLDRTGLFILSFLNMSKYEGASALLDGYCFVFVSKRFQGRMLFTLAHEIAHVIAHHTAEFGIALDKPSQIGRHSTKMEAFADAFASCLLMPERGVARALGAIRSTLNVSEDAIGDIEIIYLSQIFGVSFQVAARRCEDLNLLPDGGGESLYQRLKKEFGSPEKRAAAAGVPPRPNIDFPEISTPLISAVRGAIRDGKCSIGYATEMLNIPILELYEVNAEDGHRH